MGPLTVMSSKASVLAGVIAASGAISCVSLMLALLTASSLLFLSSQKDNSRHRTIQHETFPEGKKFILMLQPLCCSIRVPPLVAKPCLSTRLFPMSQSYRSASRQTTQSILDSRQEHVLADWNAMSSDQQSQLASALGAVDIPYVMRCFQQSMQAAGDQPACLSACLPSLQGPGTHKLACVQTKHMPRQSPCRRLRGCRQAMAGAFTCQLPPGCVRLSQA